MEDELVRVFATPSAMEGELAKGRLEAEGIPVLLMGPAVLFVPSAFEAQARLILETVEDAPDEDEVEPETAE
jgi:hypothetical protein